MYLNETWPGLPDTESERGIGLPRSRTLCASSLSQSSPAQFVVGYLNCLGTLRWCVLRRGLLRAKHLLFCPYFVPVPNRGQLPCLPFLPHHTLPTYLTTGSLLTFVLFRETLTLPYNPSIFLISPRAQHSFDIVSPPHIYLANSLPSVSPGRGLFRLRRILLIYSTSPLALHPLQIHHVGRNRAHRVELQAYVPPARILCGIVLTFLSFPGPFTVEVARILRIKNPNQSPIAFKVCGHSIPRLSRHPLLTDYATRSKPPPRSSTIPCMPCSLRKRLTTYPGTAFAPTRAVLNLDKMSRLQVGASRKRQVVTCH